MDGVNPIDEAFARAREACPGVSLSPVRFRAHVLGRGVGEGDLVANAADLFLVAAALDGDARAVSIFYQRLKVAASIASRVDRAPGFVDEVCQELSVRLLTGDQPRLLTYSATGRLLDWLRVAALRTALNLKRASRAVPDDDAPLELILGAAEETALLGAYVPDFRRAIEAGFRRLTVRERTLLRLHFLDGLNIDRIGVMYGVHRATVARWLVAIRAGLLADVKRAIADTHGLDSAAVHSVYRAIASAVQVTLSRVLAG